MRFSIRSLISCNLQVAYYACRQVKGNLVVAYCEETVAAPVRRFSHWTGWFRPAIGRSRLAAASQSGLARLSKARAKTKAGLPRPRPNACSPLWVIRIGFKHEEVVLAIGFHKVVLLDQAISRLGGFPLHDILLNSVILSIAVAVDDADARSAV